MDHKLTVPRFESKLPAELLAEVKDPTQRFLFSKLDEIGQAQTWLISQTVTQNAKLDSIETQCLRTNGRVSKTEQDVIALQADHEPLQRTVATVEWFKSLPKSRTFWICAIVVMVWGLPLLVTHAPAIQASMKSWISIFGG